MVDKKVKDVVDPSDVFVSIEWLGGLATGDSVYVTVEDILNRTSAVDGISEDILEDIIETYNSLSFEELKGYNGNLDFLADCFSSYEDFEEYVRSHKCYTAGFYYSRDGARPVASYDFYVFM